MELNKYYIPISEEFNTSFLWELKDGKEWITMGGYPKNLLKLISKNKVRVKYLDQKDIESLDFKYQKNNTYYRKLTDKILLRLETLKNNTLLIEYFVNGSNTLNFLIIIKNKSELKKLLKQLNIWN